VIEADNYAKRYGVGLQEVLFGKDYMPDGDVMSVVAKLTTMLTWYENAREQMNIMEIKDINDEVLDDPKAFNRFIESKREQDKIKRK